MSNYATEDAKNQIIHELRRGKTNHDVALPVFDMENNAWRSFRWDSVQKIDFLG